MRISRTGAFAAGVVATVVVGAGTAAASAPAALLLGHANTAVKATTLTDGHGTPLSLKAEKGHPALAVNTTTEVKNLNAALVGGRSASAFLPVGGTAVNAGTLDGQPASAFLPVGGTAASAVSATTAGTAANATALNGQPASAYLNQLYISEAAAGLPLDATTNYATLTLAAGSYLLSLDADFTNTSGTAADVGCELVFSPAAGTGSLGRYAEAVVPAVTGLVSGFASSATQDPRTFTVTTIVGVTCLPYVAAASSITVSELTLTSLPEHFVGAPAPAAAVAAPAARR